MLEGWGFSVSTASEGRQALEIYKEAFDKGESFHVVIMDLTIPGGMGGKEAIEEFLKINPEVKCIVSSGYASDPVMKNYNNYGFKGIVVKPYTPKKLLEILNQVLEE